MDSWYVTNIYLRVTFSSVITVNNRINHTLYLYLPAVYVFIYVTNYMPCKVYSHVKHYFDTMQGYKTFSMEISYKQRVYKYELNG